MRWKYAVVEVLVCYQKDGKRISVQFQENREKNRSPVPAVRNSRTSIAWWSIEINQERTAFTRSRFRKHFSTNTLLLMTFSIVCGSDGEVLNPRVSLLDGAWFGIMLCIHTVMVLLFYRYVCISSTNVVSPSLSVGVNIIILLPEIIGGVVSTLNLCNRFKIVRILNTFKVFDTKVKLHTWIYSIRFLFPYLLLAVQIHRWLSLVFT